jgi:4-hydroxybenzoate polyprenyltransferase
MMESAVVYPRRFASLVKFEHTVFALPFAYVGSLLALDEVPSAGEIVWLTLAMVGGRSFAMAVNRLVDAGIDARNPRTAGRELPQGALRPWQVAAFCAVSLALFLLAVFNLDPVVRWLWPIPVAMFVVYPYLKRVTWLSHAWLGATLGLAPVGGWVAMTGELPLAAWLLGGGVAAWVAGFDVLYAVFDIEIDRAQSLHSFPARFGVRAAFWCARVLHVTTVVLLGLAGAELDAGILYWLGVGAVAALLAYEHAIVSPGDLRRLNTAFFTLNGVISIVFFCFVFADVAL